MGHLPCHSSVELFGPEVGLEEILRDSLYFR